MPSLICKYNIDVVSNYNKVACRYFMPGDCIDHGWPYIGFPTFGLFFSALIILSAERSLDVSCVVIKVMQRKLHIPPLPTGSISSLKEWLQMGHLWRQYWKEWEKNYWIWAFFSKQVWVHSLTKTSDLSTFKNSHVCLLWSLSKGIVLFDFLCHYCLFFSTTTFSSK